MPSKYQFQEENPIIQVQPIASRAKGQEAIAEAFGHASNKLFEISANMGEVQSNANFLNGQSAANDIKTAAKIGIKQNPLNSTKIIESTKQELDNVKSNVMLNKADRARFDYLLSNDINSLQMEGAIGQKNVLDRNMQLKFYLDYPNQLKAMSEATDRGDFKGAEIIQNNIIGNATALYSAKLMGVQAYANIFNTFHGLHDRSSKLLSLLSPGASTGESSSESENVNGVNASPEDIQKSLSAKNYHQIAGVFKNPGEGMVGAPVNQNTAHLYDDSVNEKSMAQNRLAIISNQYTDPSKFSLSVAQASDTNFQVTAQEIRGASDAHAIINSGHQFEIDSRISQLESKGTLGTSDQAELDSLKLFTSQLTHGSWVDVQKNTVMGANISNDLNTRLNAINSGTYTPAEQGSLTRFAIQDSVDKYISMGESQHQDPKLIQPYSQELAAPVQQAFSPNGDPNVALSHMQYLGTYLRQSYMANAMKDPVQRETVQTIALANQVNAVPEVWKSELIQAQKTLNPELAKQIQADSKVIIAAKSYILSKSSSILNYINQDNAPGEDRVDGFTKMVYNKSIVDALKNNDFALENINQYVDKNIEHLSQAYQVETNNYNFSYNKTQLPIQPEEFSKIAHYEQNKVYEALLGKLSRAQADLYIDMNPLHTYLSNNNHIVVTDGHTILSNIPYHDGMRAASNKWFNDYEKEHKDQFAYHMKDYSYD